MHKKLYLVRLVVVLGCMLGVYVALSCHLYRLQVGRHEELYEKARKVYTSSKTQKGRRGRIFDASGNLLAGNLAGRDLLAEPRRFRNRTDEIVEVLSDLLDLDAHALRRSFEQEGRVEVVVKRGVDIRTAESILEYEFPGIRGVDSYRRYYPKDALLANMLGYLDYEGKGVSGIEKLLDDVLQPTEGRTVYERDRVGNPLQDGKRSEEEPRDGADVHLTIDEPIQQIVEEELRELVADFRPKAACGVMLNPKTGALLAVAQYPAFNPNDRATMADGSACQNRVLLQGFEPGSVMKPIALAGALDYGVVTLDDIFDCEHGYWVYCRRPLRDSGHQYDDLTVREIIQKSSNIGTAKIAILMGESRLYNTLLRFGFGAPTGLGFRQESRGILRSVDDWDGLSITRFPIGQGVLVTPLQLVQAYGALANGGILMKPYIIEKVHGYHPAELPPELSMQVAGRAVRPEACARIVEAMKLVTKDGGTATKAAVDGYEVAGKTGTAQKYVSDNGGPGYYSHDRYVAAFVGFVPADDPAFVLLVAADEPQGSSYGGTVAAPTFSRIAEKTLRYLQIAPTSGPLSTIAGNYGATHGADDSVSDVP